MRDTKLIKRTLIYYGTTQCKLPNKPEGLFYPLALYGLFTYYMSYRTGQTDFHLLALCGLLHKLPNRPDGFPLALLRLAARATEQARRTSTLWHFYGLFDCETLNRSNGLPFSDT